MKALDEAVRLLRDPDGDVRPRSITARKSINALAEARRKERGAINKNRENRRAAVSWIRAAQGDARRNKVALGKAADEG